MRRRCAVDPEQKNQDSPNVVSWKMITNDAVLPVDNCGARGEDTYSMFVT